MWAVIPYEETQRETRWEKDPNFSRYFPYSYLSNNTIITIDAINNFYYIEKMAQISTVLCILMLKVIS